MIDFTENDREIADSHEKLMQACTDTGYYKALCYAATILRKSGSLDEAKQRLADHMAEFIGA